MATKRVVSEAKSLEMYRIALENVRAQPHIASSMAGFAYGPEKIEEGKAFWSQAQSALERKHRLKSTAGSVFRQFMSTKKEFSKQFSLHRRKAKIVFADSAVFSDQLLLTKPLPQQFVAWLEFASKFYSVSTINSEIQAKLNRLRVSREELLTASFGISALESARSAYIRAKGEAQDATHSKNLAFKKLDLWMREFYAVARLALSDAPQLMEALGKKVRAK